MISQSLDLSLNSVSTAFFLIHWQNATDPN
uniref:Uncharacterized protein n=1 Tax=Rhizophora mucronata TaxID=61149 RepID=A0A2P2MZL4_RHIMU